MPPPTLFNKIPNRTSRKEQTWQMGGREYYSGTTWINGTNLHRDRIDFQANWRESLSRPEAWLVLASLLMVVDAFSVQCKGNET